MENFILFRLLVTRCGRGKCNLKRNINTMYKNIHSLYLVSFQIRKRSLYFELPYYACWSSNLRDKHKRDTS